MADRACLSCQLPIPEDAAFCAQCGTASATQIFGETLSGGRRSGAVSVSYELEPASLQQALGPSFELGRLIGRGGYAEVFAVRDLRLKRDLAIKVLRPDLIVTPSILARFRREAEAVAALAHPNIVPVFDVGEAAGICYIIMPLVQGESLKSVLQRQRRLPVDEVRRIVVEAANALAAAHKAGVIHRDIKPENIMLEGAERRVLVMDFGISKAMDSGDVQLTGTGVIVGTPQYMSPEQASGDPTIDQRTDQYSLAVVAYQMMSGRAPFDGETARAIMAKQLLEEPTPLPELVDNLPDPVSAALFRALQKDPKKRFETVAEFAQVFSAGSVDEVPTWGTGPAETPIGTRDPSGRWLPWTIASIAVLVAWSGVRRLQPPGAAAPTPVASTSISQPAGALPGSVAPPPSPVAGPPRPALTDRPIRSRAESTIATIAPLGPDTVRPAPIAPIGCAAAYAGRDWPLAYQRCSAEASTNPLAARYAGELASEGKGTAKDERLANEWYEAAAKNDPLILLLLAERYDQGIGSEQDPSRATDYYLKAANKGIARAFVIVGQRLDKGIGVPRNELEAAGWFERAAATGHIPSQIRVAELYTQGRVVARNDSAAKYWFEQASAAGNATAQFALAKLFFRGGKGIPRSDELGLVWLQRAVAGGSAEAKKELDRRRRG